MKAKVFISYRRSDSRYQARMLFDALCGMLPRENVFMDVDTISPGSDYTKILAHWVDNCSIMLVLIGPGWLDAADAETGRRRLDDQSDYVRAEVLGAMAYGKTIVPVLLDGAAMPSISQLPADLQAFALRQAETIDFRTFDFDAQRMFNRLKIGGIVIPPDDALPSARVVFVGRDGEANEREISDGGAMTLGRSRANDLIFENESVSTHHAKLTFIGGALMIHDLNSKNGVYVNDSRIAQPMVLVANDIVRLCRNGPELRVVSGGIAQTVTE